MGDQSGQGRPRLRAVGDGDTADGTAGEGGQDPARAAQGREDPDGGRAAATPEATRRLANAEKLTEALDGVRNSNFAILKELRNGRKYRKQNPPRLEALEEWACEQCGTSRRSFDDLVHHQMTEHPAAFLQDGELNLGQAACLCRSCDPAAWIDWQRTPEARGAK